MKHTQANADLLEVCKMAQLYISRSPEVKQNNQDAKDRGFYIWQLNEDLKQAISKAEEMHENS